jgi:hypothetical protein
MREMIALAKRGRARSISRRRQRRTAHRARALKNAAKIEDPCPYKGAAPAVTICSAAGEWIVRRLRCCNHPSQARGCALAVASRSVLPSPTPTMTERDCRASRHQLVWRAVAAKTPPEVIAKLHDAIVKSLNDADREKLVSRGADHTQYFGAVRRIPERRNSRSGAEREGIRRENRIDHDALACDRKGNSKTTPLPSGRL